MGGYVSRDRSEVGDPSRGEKGEGWMEGRTDAGGKGQEALVERGNHRSVPWVATIPNGQRNVDKKCAGCGGMPAGDWEAGRGERVRGDGVRERITG